MMRAMMRSTSRTLPRYAAIAAALTAFSSAAQAHTGVGVTSGFGPGLAHPMLGLDHLCAMLGVGLWAGQQRGRALWAIPLTFVAVMAAGGALGMAGMTMPFVESGIAASVLVLGCLVAFAVQLPVFAGMTLVGAFALFHGHSHGTEIPAGAAGLAYGIGFMLATAGLHAIGIGLATALSSHRTAALVRFAGAAIAACGVIWLVG
jgi:urease accessory protein